jgi:hypothetical protein
VSLEAAGDTDNPLAPAVEESPLKVSAGELIAKSDPKPDLMADVRRGTLVIDSGTPIIKSTRRQEATGCSASGGGKPLRPITANDVRVQGPSSGCP